MTTDSTASDDDTPPPLPAKTRESEYSNLSDRDSLGLSDYCSPIIINNIMVCNIFIYVLYNKMYKRINKYLNILYFNMKPSLPLVNNNLEENVRPPTPPPKKPPMKAPI